MFGAFRLLYATRTADLVRIATHGLGELSDGDIPDLAAGSPRKPRAARSPCCRCAFGRSNCPPVNITFGDYLRAIVTADVNLNPDDDLARVAMVESFREWGIYRRDIRSMSIEGLTWPSGAEVIADAAIESNLGRSCVAARGHRR